MDMDGFLSFLTPDAGFRFGSSPAVSGHEAIRAAVGGFFSSIAALSHDLRGSIENGETIVCEGEVTYTRHSGSKITLPFADVFEMRDGLIADYKIYMDIAPLFAE